MTDRALSTEGPTEEARTKDEGWSLCPECFTEVRCRYVVHDGAVHQEKTCPEHGGFSSQVWADEAHWDRTETFTRQAEACAVDSCGPTGAEIACCGPDAAPDAKKCLAVVNVTDDCDLACNYCFASSRPGLLHVPFDDVVALLETTLREAGGPIPIQISGGEPTTRDDLPEIVAHAHAMGFRHIEVNTNGVRVAREPGLVKALKEAGVSALYLQMDGFGDEVHEAIRDAKLDKVKTRAIAHARAAGMPVILVPVVVKGVNDHQLGDILRFALDNLDVVRGVNFQPVSHFGRHEEDRGHLDLGAVADLIESQTRFLRARDLYHVPCCSPKCSSATYLVKLPGMRPMPLTRFVSEEAYKDFMAAFDERGLIPALAGDPMAPDMAKAAASCCGISVPPGADRLLPHALAVSVTGFMDADNVDLDRLSQCCIRVPTPEGRLVPFCGYNLTTRDGDYALRRRYAEDAGNVVEVSLGGLRETATDGVGGP